MELGRHWVDGSTRSVPIFKFFAGIDSGGPESDGDLYWKKESRSYFNDTHAAKTKLKIDRPHTISEDPLGANSSCQSWPEKEMHLLSIGTDANTNTCDRGFNFFEDNIYGVSTVVFLLCKARLDFMGIPQELLPGIVESETVNFEERARCEEENVASASYNTITLAAHREN
ncbi:hypothetical protein BJV82DRAFT_579344 [Fennellomyces sp. T-0311]|nr:hypothetical protein BJV82DRAFT_579344 [Fennellomyces sp. T-0311]